MLPGVSDALNPIGDVLETMMQFMSDIGTRSGILFGRIQSAIPYVNSYRVMPEGGGSVLQCCYLRDMPATPVSVADHKNLHVGVNVFYIIHPTAHYGVILGVEPPYITDSRKARSDCASQGSRSGIDVEPHYKNLWQIGPPNSNAGIIDWSGRQPVDSVPIGEFCKTSMTGIQLFMDQYMAHMRVDEMCGMWMFYWDSLMRIAGQNFQRWTSGSEFESMDDEGEHFWYQGIAPFPWENWGQLQVPAGSDPEDRLDVNDAKTAQKTNQEYAHLEPLYDDVQAFHRVREYNGYMGQAGKRLICQPPVSPPVVQQYGNDLTHIGLFEANHTLAGHLAIRSARGITIGRRPVIPVPKRKKTLTDTTGDTVDNYRTSGQYGGGQPHKLTVEPAMKAAAGQEQLSRVAGLHDWHANVFNWEAAHPFHYHDKDYYYPNESDIASGDIDSNQYIPEWSDLKKSSAWYLPEPEKTINVLKVDHREGYQDFIYKVSQYLSFTEDGAVVLGDGSGSEIRMLAGNIHLQCAGDVFMEAGRNVMTWAGRDLILRAYQSADITATMNDVRIKAEHNIQMISANDGGPYGILLECRASGTQYDFSKSGQDAKNCGIIFHAPCAEILNLADNIYLRTGVPSAKSSGQSGGDPPIHGDIVIDAVSGTRNVSIWGHTVAHYVQCGVVHAFGTAGNFTKTTAFMPTGADIAGSVYIDGALANDGPHILSGVVGENENVSAGKAHQAALTSWISGKWTSDIQQNWYGTGRPGNDGMLKGMWGSLRETADYNSAGFVLYETRWAQMGRIEGNIPMHWDERKVDDGNGSTMPFPGYEQFQTKQAYYKQDNTLYNMKTGLSQDRGTAFEAPSYAEPQKQQLNCNYPIVGP